MDQRPLKYLVSKKANIICKKNKIYRISDLLQHDLTLIKYNNFKDIIDLFELYIKLSYSNIENKDIFHLIKIKDLYKENLINVRSMNACSNIKLFSLKELLDYLIIGNKIISFKNCGVKSAKELLLICYKYLSDDSLISADDVEKVQRSFDIHTNSQELSFELREILSTYLNQRLKSTSVRFKNVFNVNLSVSFNYKKYQEILIKNLSTFKNARNIGSRTIIEIENINAELNLIITNFADKKLSNKAALVNLMLKNIFDIESQNLLNEQELQEDNIYDLILKLTGDIRFCSPVEYEILHNYREFNFYEKSKNLTLEEIATLFNITRERVRQLKIKTLEKFYSSISLLSFFYSKEVTENKFSFFETDSVIENIKNNFFTDYTTEFVIIIMGLIYGNYDIIESFNYKNLHQSFIVLEKISKGIIIDKFLKDTIKLVAEKRTQDLILPIDGYIYNYIENQNSYEEMKQVCTDILLEVFDVFTDSDENIIFPRNTALKREEHIIEILEEFDRPATAEEIFTVYSKRIENSTIESLRGIIANSQKIKSSRGGHQTDRYSRYILIKWEKEGKYIGGSIRDLVLNELKRINHTLHVEELEIFLNVNGKDIDSANIYGNLIQDAKKRFSFYSEYLVGLKKDCEAFNAKIYIQDRKVTIHMLAYIKELILSNNNSLSINYILTTISNKINIPKSHIKHIIKKEITFKTFKYYNGFISINFDLEECFQYRTENFSKKFLEIYRFLLCQSTPMHLQDILNALNISGKEEYLYQFLRYYGVIEFFPMKFVGILNKEYNGLKLDHEKLPTSILKIAKSEI